MATRPMVYPVFAPWRPATLAQAPSVIPPSTKIPIFDEPLVQLGIDFAAMMTSGLLAALRASHGQPSTVWWVVSGMAAVKGLHDLSRMERK